MAATVAHSQATNMPSSNGLASPSAPSQGKTDNAGSQDMADVAADGGAAPMPPTRKFQLGDFRLVRTLGTGGLPLLFNPHSHGKRKQRRKNERKKERKTERRREEKKP